MDSNEKGPTLDVLRQGLVRWYWRQGRDLPWRQKRKTEARPDPYAVWVSEVVLQQTRVSQAAAYFNRFMERFPRLEDLAKATEEEVLKVWEGLGYYRRARNLHRCAKIVCEQYNGRFPRHAAELRQLPGIGRNTANAIASIAYGEGAPVLDGNVIRVLARLFDLCEPVDKAATRSRLWRLAESLLPKDSPGNFNQAMMDLGATVCTPKRPRCGDCPVRPCCRAYANQTQDRRPVRARKRPVPHYEIVVAAIEKNGRLLLGKRPSEGFLGGLWELPGGRVKSGESPQEALAREVLEELGVRVQVGERIATVRHAYTHFRVTIHVYRCTHTRGTFSPRFHVALRWAPKSQLGRFPLPKANHKFLHLLR